MSLSGTDAPPNADLLNLLDFDPEPHCEFQSSPSADECGTVAVWLLVLSCGHSFYYCQPHHDAIDAKVSRGFSLHCVAGATLPGHPSRMRVQHHWVRV